MPNGDPLELDFWNRPGVVLRRRRLSGWKTPLKEEQTSERMPFPKNVPGDFYVEDGCCTSCGMPTTEAPELFAYAPDGHCYVRQ